MAGTVPPAAVPAREPVLVRASFRFSPSGARAACLAGSGDGDLALEAWSFGGAAPSWRRLALERPVTLGVQLLPLDDGRVLLCRSESSHSHQLSLVEPEATGAARERVLAMMACQGLRLLSGPGAEEGGRGTGAAHDAPARALAIAFDERGASTLWRVSERRPWLERLAEVPGLLLGGAWLDRAGAVLGADRMERPEDGPAKVIAVDLTDGSWSTLLDVAERSNDRLLLASPRSGLVVVSTDAPGEARLGWTLLGRQPVRFPPALRRQGLRPLATDPEGQQVLLKVEAGVRSRLATYDPAADRLAPVQTPDGHIGNTACWERGALRFPFSTPAHPTGVATVELGRDGCTVAGLTTDASGWAGARVEVLERLGGCQELHDSLGPRDLLRLVPRLRARLLLIHGSDDEVIPVAHSRALRQRLLDLGRREGEHFDYLEVPSGCHDLVATAGTPALREHVVRFLTGSGPAGERPAHPGLTPGSA